MGLGILRMRPFDTEVLALEEVLCTLLALLVDRIVQRKISRELVLHQIARIQVHRPGTEGVVVSCHSKVKVVSEDEIHSGIPEIEASGILLAERRHQKTGRPGRLLRDETERDAHERDADILHNQIRRSEDRFLGRFGDHLRRTHIQIEMRMFEFADRVLSFRDVDRAVRHHLDVLSVEDAVLLCCYHVRDPRLVRVEIVADLLHVEGFAALGHRRLSLPFSREGVESSPREDNSCQHVILHVVGREFHVVVGDCHITIIIHLPLAVGEILTDRILGSGECRKGNGALRQKVQRIRPRKGIRPHQRIPDHQRISSGQGGQPGGIRRRKAVGRKGDGAGETVNMKGNATRKAVSPASEYGISRDRNPQRQGVIGKHNRRDRRIRIGIDAPAIGQRTLRLLAEKGYSCHRDCERRQHNGRYMLSDMQFFPIFA